MARPAFLFTVPHRVRQLAVHHTPVRRHHVEGELGRELDHVEELVGDVQEGERGGVDEAGGALLQPPHDPAVLLVLLERQQHEVPHPVHQLQEGVHRPHPAQQRRQLPGPDVGQPGRGRGDQQLVQAEDALPQLQLPQGQLAAVEGGEAGQDAGQRALGQVHVLAHVVYADGDGGAEDEGLEVQVA